MCSNSKTSQSSKSFHCSKYNFVCTFSLASEGYVISNEFEIELSPFLRTLPALTTTV